MLAVQPSSDWRWPQALYCQVFPRRVQGTLHVLLHLHIPYWKLLLSHLYVRVKVVHQVVFAFLSRHSRDFSRDLSRRFHGCVVLEEGLVLVCQHLGEVLSWRVKSLQLRILALYFAWSSFYLQILLLTILRGVLLSFKCYLPFYRVSVLYLLPKVPGDVHWQNKKLKY